MSDQSTIPPKSTQVSHWVLLELLTEIWVRGYLQKLKCPKDSCHQKSHPSMGDNSQNLETWISGHSLQVSQRVGEGSFQETTSLFFSPQFILSPLPPGNLAGLSHSESLSSPLLLRCAWRRRDLENSSASGTSWSYWVYLWDGKSHLHLEHPAAVPPFYPMSYQFSLQNGRF